MGVRMQHIPQFKWCLGVSAEACENNNKTMLFPEKKHTS